MAKEKYSEEERKILLKKLLDFADELGSVKKTEKFTGVSASVISALKSDDGYKGDADKMYEKIDAYFSAMESAENQTLNLPKYVPTSVSENVYAIIRNCQLNGGLAVVCGDAGIGKTKAAQKFAEDNKNMAVLISANECVKSVRSVLKILCTELGIYERAIDEMWLAAANKLHDKMVIIIDEAQHLPVRTIEALRALSDYFTDRGQTLGVIFIGNDDVSLNFKTNKRAEFAQIINRTKLHCHYYTSNITREDVAKVFPMFAAKKKELDFLHAIAQSKQALRGVSNLCVHAYDRGTMDYEGLVTMAKGMNMEI